MPSRLIEFFILDILIAIDSIKRHTANLENAQDFAYEELVYNSSLRDLEVIGEAMKNIMSSEKLKSFAKPEWRRIISFRNIVAHEYFGISIKEVFTIIKTKIPVLEKEMFELIKNFKDDKDLWMAINGLRKDLEVLNRKEGLKYIDKIESFLKAS
jgi:uncharacterized protein with HEPN domain